MNIRVCLVSVVIVAFISVSLVSAEVHSKAGTTGMSFLKIGVGGRASAMAGAYTAVSGDQTCSYWNPAGLIGSYRQSGTLMHGEWLQGIRYEYAGWAGRREADAWGASFAFQSSGKLERRGNRPTQEPWGTFSVYDLALTFSYARALSNLNIGVSGKFLYEKIYTEDASGGALDLGILYHPGISGLSIGTALRNLGGTNAMRDQAIPLPMVWQVGTAYLWSLPGMSSGVLLALDVRVPNDAGRSIHVGIEYQSNNMLSLRAGYRTGAEEHNIGMGFGIQQGALQIDYAYVPYYFDLGDTHRISLSWRTG